jgi:ketosteroid isomerase-like protein
MSAADLRASDARYPTKSAGLQRAYAGSIRVCPGESTRRRADMASKTDLLRERYEQFSQGDIESALSNWTDDFTWEGGNSEDMPGGGTHRGKEQSVQVLQQAVGAWDEFKLSADEFYENGDTVVVLGHTDVKKGDESAQLPVVHIWRFRGDDEVCRLQILTDTLQGARMLGKA